MADSAIASEPMLADGYFLKGRALSMMRRYDDAKAAYLKALELDPEYLVAGFNLGNMAYHLEEYESSLEHYMNALNMRSLRDARDGELDVKLPRKDISTGLLQIGRVYSKLAQPEEASQAYEYALLFDELNPQIHYDLAVFYNQNGDDEAALAAAEKAVSLDSTDVEFRYQYANQLVRVGRFEEAVPVLEAILEARPWQEGAHYNMAQALTQLGREDEAAPFFVVADSMQKQHARVEEFKHNAESNPRSPYWWNALGMAYASAGRDEDAIETFRFVIMLNQENAPAWYNLAVVYDKIGEDPLARYSLRRAIEVEPGFTEATEMLQRLMNEAY